MAFFLLRGPRIHNIDFADSVYLVPLLCVWSLDFRGMSSLLETKYMLMRLLYVPASPCSSSNGDGQQGCWWTYSGDPSQ